MAMYNRIECPTRIGLGFWMEQEHVLTEGRAIPLKKARTPSGVVKKVMDLETGTVYESAYAASESVGCKPENIMLVCRGKAWTAKGKRWVYLDREGQPMVHLLNTEEKSQGKAARRIRETTTGQIFDTLGQAAQALGVAKSSLSHYLAGRQRTIKGGYHVEEV